MKKILCVLLSCFLILGLCGCASAVEEIDKSDNDVSMFIKIETFSAPHGGGAYVFYHRETKVMYIISHDGVATVMLNPDGTPQLYSE